MISTLFNKKIRSRFLTGTMINSIAKKNLKNPIIFHAASAGEFEQIKPLLRAYKSNNPIIQTFFSPTIYNKEKDSKLFNECCYHPFDFPWTAYFFFKKLRPSKYIVNRHDISPETNLYLTSFIWSLPLKWSWYPFGNRWPMGNLEFVTLAPWNLEPWYPKRLSTHVQRLSTHDTTTNWHRRPGNAG